MSFSNLKKTLDQIPGYILTIADLRIMVTVFPIPPQAEHVVVLSGQQLDRVQERMWNYKYENKRLTDTSLSSSVGKEKTSAQSLLTAEATPHDLTNVQPPCEYLHTSHARPLAIVARVLRNLFQIPMTTVYTMYDCGIVSIVPEVIFQEILMSPSINHAEPKEEIHYEI